MKLLKCRMLYYLLALSFFTQLACGTNLTRRSFLESGAALIAWHASPVKTQWMSGDSLSIRVLQIKKNPYLRAHVLFKHFGLYAGQAIPKTLAGPAEAELSSFAMKIADLQHQMAKRYAATDAQVAEELDYIIQPLMDVGSSSLNTFVPRKFSPLGTHFQDDFVALIRTIEPELANRIRIDLAWFRYYLPRWGTYLFEQSVPPIGMPARGAFRSAIDFTQYLEKGFLPEIKAAQTFEELGTGETETENLTIKLSQSSAIYSDGSIPVESSPTSFRFSSNCGAFLESNRSSETQSSEADIRDKVE